jgi:glutathione S-transferase
MGRMTAQVDTTPIIRDLEARTPDRAACPSDLVTSFLNDVIEEFADEWISKLMFHFRWTQEADIRHGGPMLAAQLFPLAPPQEIVRQGKAWGQRQIGRLDMVGSNSETATAIEACLPRLARLLEAVFSGRGFLLGQRPASADFAVHGQLTQLALLDPSPTAIIRGCSPLLDSWVHLTEDLSGLEPDPQGWDVLDVLLSRLAPLLTEIGQTYVPFAVANAGAVAANAPTFEADILDCRWQQPSNRYQAKCYQQIKAAGQKILQDASIPRDQKDALQTAFATARCTALISDFA